MKKPSTATAAKTRRKKAAKKRGKVFVTKKATKVAAKLVSDTSEPKGIKRRKRVSAEKLSKEKLAELRAIRDQVEAERPEISARANARRLLIGDVVKALKEERESRGLSLAQVAGEMGVDRSNLLRLERSTNATLKSVTDYATALGKTLFVHLGDAK